MREVKRHGYIIALSQSELMLVIALIFLLLFYVAVTPAEHNPDDQKPTPELTPDIEENKPHKEVDKEQEVEKELNKDSKPQNEGEEPTLVQASENRESNPQTKEKSNEEIIQELLRVLEKEGSIDQDSSANKEQILQAVKEVIEENKKAKEGLKSSSTLESVVDQLLKDTGTDAQGDKSESLKELGKRLNDYKIKDEIGFIPCWLGRGSPRYYRTFHMTYSGTSNKYSIEPHPDWNSNDSTVSRDVQSRLPSLNEYPKGLVDEEVMVNFAQKLNAEKEKAHGQVCNLATTINKEANGKIVADIILGHMNLYPVWR